MIGIRSLLRRLTSSLRRLQRSSISSGAGEASAPVRRPPVFHSYKTRRNEAREIVIIDENTLGDEIRNRYLRNAVIWLLGYDARFPLKEQQNDQPIRSQSISCFWQIGWNIADLVKARELLTNDDELVQEIDRKLLHPEWGCLAWLLRKVELRTENSFNWDQRVYETSVVIEALLSIAERYRDNLDSEMINEINRVVRGGLHWLFRELENPLEAEDQTRPWGVTLRALAAAVNTGEYNEETPHFVAHLEDTLVYIYERETASEIIEFGEEKPKFIGDIIQGLASALIISSNQVPKNLIQQARLALGHSVEMIETRFKEGESWSPSRNRLFQYVLAWTAAYPNHIDNMDKSLIIQVLADLVTDGSVLYEDGSIYHSLYVTTYYIHALITLANSVVSETSIYQLYEELLRPASRQISDERRRNFSLERQIQRLTQEHEKLTNHNEFVQRQYKRVRRLFVSSSTLLIWLILFSGMAWILGVVEVGTTVMGLRKFTITDLEAFIGLITLGVFFIGAILAISELFWRE